MKKSITEAKVLSVNTSEKKGVIKKPVGKITIDANGVLGDAHAGDWHRQVSLLGIESVRKFENIMGREIAFGEFAENITTEGIVLYETKPLDLIQVGEAMLEVTQIGKKCHGDRCAIFNQVGSCVMPKEGIFGRVINEGVVKENDQLLYFPKKYKALVITLSDRASKAEYSDRSGPEVKKMLEAFFEENGWDSAIETALIPDDESRLANLLEEAGTEKVDMIFTTGGTGIGKRDITPEVVREFVDKEIPGIMELIRYKYGSEKPNALLSRGVAGVMDQTLVYAMPGSVKAVKEYMTEILKTIRHSIYMLHGLDLH